ncbi:MAG: DUF1800 family protein [Acidobacteriota bacterium]
MTNTPRQLNREAAAHFLRRLAFAATPSRLAAVRGLSPAEALSRLVEESRSATLPTLSGYEPEAWTNSALRLPNRSEAEQTALQGARDEQHRSGIEQVRRWWIEEAVSGTAPLRENLTLCFESTFGSSTQLVDVPHALYGRNATIRRHCLGTVPALLQDLVLDPAMMIQIGTDEHFRIRMSDRGAKLILDHWTVGKGSYENADVENLSKALTGWRLESSPSRASRLEVDPSAPRPDRRTGLTPIFDEKQFDARPKTLLGTTGAFDARSALRHLALHPATARRWSALLGQHLGVEKPSAALSERLASAYESTGGEIVALLDVIVTSDEFWAPENRWNLIKSPLHLVAGACQQLEIAPPPTAEISRWLEAAGQVLFDTPNGGEGGWPGAEDWVSSSRLAVRYQLPDVLAGRPPSLGIRGPQARDSTRREVPLPESLRNASAAELRARLDPAPGLDVGILDQAAQQTSNPASAAARRILQSPEYQLA